MYFAQMLRTAARTRAKAAKGLPPGPWADAMRREEIEYLSGRVARSAGGGNMPDAKAVPAAKSISRASRLGMPPFGAELGYTMLALFSFAAALYALRLAGIGAGLIPSPHLVTSNPAAMGSAPAELAWGPVVLACLVAAGLIWVSVRMLNKSSNLATVRQLVALTEELDISDGIKLEVIVAAAGIEFQRVAPKPMARPPDDDAVRAAVAGNWVLKRFQEGASVVSVPKSLATSERLQTAFGSPSDPPIQILHNNPDLQDAGRVS
jgi:hypothetical protein